MQVDFVSEPIKRFTEKGIETADGKVQELDVVFLATGVFCPPLSSLIAPHRTPLIHIVPSITYSGYDTSFKLPFPILGRGGRSLNARFTPHPETYLSVCVDGFPNLFMSLGPNSAVGSGSLLALIEFEVLYAVQAAAKMQRERLKSIEIKTEALREFDRYLEVRGVLRAPRLAELMLRAPPELLPQGPFYVVIRCR